MRRPSRPRLLKEIALILAVKFAALFLIWWAWFSEPQDRGLNSAAIGRAVYADPSNERTDHAPRHGSR